MVFCNVITPIEEIKVTVVTILILIDGFLQFQREKVYLVIQGVTILILIDGFLQLVIWLLLFLVWISHNPYFNRWFSAMGVKKILHSQIISHNPYFNRWFSAMTIRIHKKQPL